MITSALLTDDYKRGFLKYQEKDFKLNFSNETNAQLIHESVYYVYQPIMIIHGECEYTQVLRTEDDEDTEDHGDIEDEDCLER